MTNEEAKFILNGYRPDGRDAEDPMFSEALKQAAADPSLAAWFARTRAHDAAVAAKLQQMAPPAGLREAILAGARVSGRSRPAWRQPVWFAAAAAVAMLIAVSTTLWPNRALARAEAVAHFALQDTAGADHDGHGSEVTHVQALLGSPDRRLSLGLGLNFEKLRATGCRTLRLGDREVFEVCFERSGTWYHLYAMADERARSERSDPIVTQRGDLSCATWSDAGNGVRYAVVGRVSPDTLRALL